MFKQKHRAADLLARWTIDGPTAARVALDRVGNIPIFLRVIGLGLSDLGRDCGSTAWGLDQCLDTCEDKIAVGVSAKALLREGGVREAFQEDARQGA